MRVIGFSGPIGAGKSTAARHLVARHGFTRLPFAAPLKSMLRTLLLGQGAPEALAERMVNGDLKEAPSPLLAGATPRRAMQLLGTEWGRTLSSSFWVDVWHNTALSHRRVVVDDVRFANELEAIHALGGLVIGLERPGAGATAEVAHPSEQGVTADVSVFNSAGCKDLAMQIDDILRAKSFNIRDKMSANMTD